MDTIEYMSHPSIPRSGSTGRQILPLVLAAAFLLAGCDGSTSSGAGGPDSSVVLVPAPLPLAQGMDFGDGGIPGNPGATCKVPADATADTGSRPDRVVGTGSRQSCTADAFRRAVAHGGRIWFDCGPDTMTIVLDAPAKVFNDSLPDIVIDGKGKIALSGGNKTRILYMNTCDSLQHWTTSHCQDQDHPRLTLQNLTFVDADSRMESRYDGGGAVWVRGGRLKVVNSRFYRNVAVLAGPDVGGGAIRAFSQSKGSPVYVVNSTFGATGHGNVASNGGALSSIMVNWSVYNSLFVGNQAVGHGGNPQDQGTPGGGSGGAIYNDGNTLTLDICGSRFERNEVNAYGAAIFFVSNNHDGLIRLTDSRVSGNLRGSWHVLPGIAMHEDTRREIVNSFLEN